MLVYCQRAREAYKGVPVIAGGVEASLRRLAITTSGATRSAARSSSTQGDLLVFGMGEGP